jgi:hypothetical protein
LRESRLRRCCNLMGAKSVPKKATREPAMR